MKKKFFTIAGATATAATVVTVAAVNVNESLSKDVQVEDQTLAKIEVLSNSENPGGIVNSSSWQTYGNNIYYFNNGGNVGINTSFPQARLQVDGNTFFNGKVGIGTNSPQTKLDIDGAMFAAGNVSIGTRNSTAVLDVKGVAKISGNVGIGTENPTAKLDVIGTAKISGNVGIGTENPTTKLDVRGSMRIAEKLGVGTSPQDHVNLSLFRDISELTSSDIIGINSTLENSNYNSSAFMTGINIDNNNFGSGETKGVYIWNVNFHRTTTCPTYGIYTFNSSASPNSTVYGIYAAAFNGRKSWAGYFDGNMYASGNVGIGTENPTVKLDVAGIARAHEVRVCLNQGCDYVFEDDYKLMNLSELSNFVKNNKHLPEVAPAAQMEAEGINVSEMNALLLKKVEELTLYVIDLKNEIDELKK